VKTFLAFGCGAAVIVALAVGEDHVNAVRVQRTEACAALFGKQFVPAGNADPVWSSPVCADLPRDDQAKAYAYAVIDYGRGAELRRADEISRAGKAKP
jgi:hypothetical protein